MSEDRKKESSPALGAGTAIGVGVGVAIGNAMDNMGAGIGIGVAVGIALAAGYLAKSKKSRAVQNEDD